MKSFLIYLFSFFLVLNCYSQTESDTLLMNKSSKIKDNYLTSIGTVHILEATDSLYFPKSLEVQLQKILCDNFRTEYTPGVILSSPSTYIILEFTKDIKIIKQKTRKNQSFKGSKKLEHWIITIDIKRNEIISKKKVNYIVYAKW